MTAKEEIIKKYENRLLANPNDFREIFNEALENYDQLVKSQNEFHTNRRMFYIKNNNVIEPIDRYKNLSHLEWFKMAHIDIKTTIRGYCSSDGKYAMIYTGLDFKEPVTTIDMLMAIKNHFPTIEYIGSGCKVDEFGNAWKPIRKISVEIKDEKNTTLHFFNE